MPDSEQVKRFRVGTDEAGQWFGVWDSSKQDWLCWGISRDEAAATARAANRGATGAER